MSQNFRFYRHEIGLSQIELAEAARVPRYKIQLSERGIASLTHDEGRRIARKLGAVDSPLPEWISCLVEPEICE